MGGNRKVDLEPSMDELMKFVDSKYTMVVAAAKRARQLTDGKVATVRHRSAKPVCIALEELAGGTLHYERTKVGIK